MPTENYLQVMIDSLLKKKEVLETIVRLNEEQTIIIGEEDFNEDMLHDNSDKKDECISQLDKLDEGFQSLFDRIKKELDANPEAYKEDIGTLKKLIPQITELSVKIEAQEKRNKELLSKKFAQMRQNIRSAKRNVKLANTYYQNMNKLDSSPQFLDQKK